MYRRRAPVRRGNRQTNNNSFPFNDGDNYGDDDDYPSNRGGNVTHIENRFYTQNNYTYNYNSNNVNSYNNRPPVRRVRRRPLIPLFCSFDPKEPQVDEKTDEKEQKEEEEEIAENKFIRPVAVISPPSTEVALRIGTGTGGPDQSGFLGKLVEAYIQDRMSKKGEPAFVVEFFASTSMDTFDLLKSNVIDVGVTDNAFADVEALTQRVAGAVVTAWYDHWLLVGPADNPAQLPTDMSVGILKSFVNLCIRLEAAMDSEQPVKYLSRFDGSACSLKEANIWTSVGQAPWTDPTAMWYTMSKTDAAASLDAAIEINAYTLTDRSTWNSVSEEVRSKLTIFNTSGPDDADPNLIKEVHLLSGSKARNKDRAEDFLSWVIDPEGGHRVIAGFEQNGNVIYSLPPGSGASAKPIEQKPAETTAQYPPRRDTARAAVNLSWSANEMYFFEGNRYVRIDAARDTITWGTAKEIAPMWPGLHSAGFQTIEAILPISPTENPALVFSGDRCVLLDVSSGQVQGSPVAWADRFPAIKKAGFPYIDAIVPNFWPNGNPAHYTFYCGKKCVTYDSKTEKLVDDRVSDWPHVFNDLGFNRIDTFVFKPGLGFREGYFFCGSKYVCLDLEHMRTRVLDTHQFWSSLKKVGFFPPS